MTSSQNFDAENDLASASAAPEFSTDDSATVSAFVVVQAGQTAVQRVSWLVNRIPRPPNPASARSTGSGVITLAFGMRWCRR